MDTQESVFSMSIGPVGNWMIDVKRERRVGRKENAGRMPALPRVAACVRHVAPMLAFFAGNKKAPLLNEAALFGLFEVPFVEPCGGFLAAEEHFFALLGGFAAGFGG